MDCNMYLTINIKKLNVFVNPGTEITIRNSKQ